MSEVPKDSGWKSNGNVFYTTSGYLDYFDQVSTTLSMGRHRLIFTLRETHCIPLGQSCSVRTNSGLLYWGKHWRRHRYPGWFKLLDKRQDINPINMLSQVIHFICCFISVVCFLIKQLCLHPNCLCTPYICFKCRFHMDSVHDFLRASLMWWLRPKA